MRNKIIIAILVIIFLAGVVWAFIQDDNNFPKNETPNADDSVEVIEKSTETFEQVSIPALSAKEPEGTDLTLGAVQSEQVLYTRHYITYKSGDLKISGIMNVPKGDGPFPILILNHGYIDPIIY